MINVSGRCKYFYVQILQFAVVLDRRQLVTFLHLKATDSLEELNPSRNFSSIRSKYRFFHPASVDRFPTSVRCRMALSLIRGNFLGRPSTEYKYERLGVWSWAKKELWLRVIQSAGNRDRLT